MEPSALIRQARRSAGLTQAELARRAGVKQPEIARLETAGANPRFETLDRVLVASGHSLKLELGRSAGIDESMIVSNLRLSPAERLNQFGQAYRGVAGLAGAARKRRGP